VATQLGNSLALQLQLVGNGGQIREKKFQRARSVGWVWQLRRGRSFFKLCQIREKLLQLDHNKTNVRVDIRLTFTQELWL